MLIDPKVQFVAVNDVQLAYRESGTSTSPPMFLLHGLAETSAFFWRPLIACFERQFRIIAVDLLGHGDSDSPSDGYEIEKQAELIALMMDQLNIPSAIFIGHSLGGVIAARLAIESPSRVQKLILYDTPLSDSPPKNFLMFLRKVPFTALALLSSVVFPKSVSRLALSVAPLRLATRLFLKRWHIPYDPNRLDNEFLDHSVRNSSVALMESARSAYMGHNIVKDLCRLNVPTCMIVGDSDMLVPVSIAERMAKLIPDAKLFIIERASHVSLIDRPQEFNDILTQFLTH
jgi:4,5:9,10-diseco-3-hydroxy-5,9,17-trioxoandrosta-1(10),2-diene-4-oate hydrolase